MTNEQDQQVISGTDVDTERLQTSMRKLAEMAPDIMDVVVATLANPAMGLEMVFKRIIEKTRNQTLIEAQIQEEAEKKFLARIDSEEERIRIDPENLQRVPDYLAQEIKRIAESAVKLNDQRLMNEVFGFYRSSLKRLFQSALDEFQDKTVLTEIQSELGVVRLKVMWADAQRGARLSKKIEEDQKLLNELEKVSKKERQLQIRVFLLLLIYVGAITAIVLLGGQVLTSNTLVPLLGIPIPIVLWSALGSLANMLYRYYKQMRVRDVEQELKWVWARPLVGIVMGAVTYLVITSGLIVLGAVTPQNQSIQLKPELLWLFAFVGGFSDRIFEGIIEKIGLISIPEKMSEESINNLVQAYVKSAAQETVKLVEHTVVEPERPEAQPGKPEAVTRPRTSSNKRNRRRNE